MTESPRTHSARRRVAAWIACIAFGSAGFFAWNRVSFDRATGRTSELAPTTYPVIAEKEGHVILTANRPAASNIPPMDAAAVHVKTEVAAFALG